jgi:hypothetical protein
LSIEYVDAFFCHGDMVASDWSILHVTCKTTKAGWGLAGRASFNAQVNKGNQRDSDILDDICYIFNHCACVCIGIFSIAEACKRS